MLFNLIRPWVVWRALVPFILSFLRDYRRYIFVGPPRVLSETQLRARAVRMRETIARLGPTFIKTAQVLGMREDLIPRLYTEQLRMLQDKVPPFALKQVEATIRRELGKPIGEVFQRFDAQPLAAASLGQVHRARYGDEEVAVKILRPNVRRTVRADLRILKGLLLILNFLIESPHLRNIWAVIQEFSRVIEQEMDFVHEGENIEKFRANFAGHERVIIPERFEALNTKEVLVLKFYEGVKVDDIAGLRALGIDPATLIETLIEVYTRQVVVLGLLHADPHPGNLLVNARQQLIILDFGMVISFDPAVRMELLKFAIAAVRQDLDGVVDGFFRLRMVEPEANMATFRDAARVMMTIRLSTDYSTKQIQAIADDLFRTFYSFPLRMPSFLVYLARSSALIEGIGLSFDPQMNSLKVSTPIVKRVVSEVHTESERTLLDRVIDKGRNILATLDNLERVLYRADREQFRVKAHESDLREIERFMVTLARRLLLGILGLTVALVSTILYSAVKNIWVLLAGGGFSLFIFLLCFAVPFRARKRLWD